MALTLKLDAIEDLPHTPASDVKKFGWRALMKAIAAKGKVVVTNHNEPQAVILSMEAYDAILEAFRAAARKRPGRPRCAAQSVRRTPCVAQEARCRRPPAQDGALGREAVRQGQGGDGPLMARPVLLVLAGVNGAGKSSIGGHLLKAQGSIGTTPILRARIARGGRLRPDRIQCASVAGRHAPPGCRPGRAPILRLRNHARRQHGACEDPGGGGDARCHRWFVGLASPEQHIARVALRVAAGGHPIPEAKIRERWPAARANLIALMPSLTELYVFDNSVDAARGKAIPDPFRVLDMADGDVTWPDGPGRSHPHACMGEAAGRGGAVDDRTRAAR